MKTYIAFLRGINVGGKNMIKMAVLKQLFETMGFQRVQTYIQSGNVLFQSNDLEGTLRSQIEQEIETIVGFAVNVVLRTAVELERIIGNCPFSEGAVAEAEASSVGESLYVSLMVEAPVQESVDRLSIYASPNEQYCVEGREVYLLFGNSVRNSKLSNNLHKLGGPATVRNWKTLSKLLVLAKTMDGA
ncbi:DUF1697 domain-containing protein [Paenibacillus glacialis]|uniref:Cytoplasmic protein n=1 Tax=Paenibacillus glacialis TaxID=494026 RepID=A0A162K7X9_9BACL|nr:DUF1697 domain-containing protein [Paenibacillus glacialis]OAB44326.1 cytoplasmic protein [Paenibacillus glacialis]